MSNTRPDNSGSAPRTGGRLTRDAEIARSGEGRWRAKRKLSVVLELLRGDGLEPLSRNYGVTVAALSRWREAFLAAGEALGGQPKECPRGLVRAARLEPRRKRRGSDEP